MARKKKHDSEKLADLVEKLADLVVKVRHCILYFSQVHYHDIGCFLFLHSFYDQVS